MMATKKKTKEIKKKPLAYTHLDYISLLGKTRNKQKRCLLIDIANNDQLKSILECIQNVLDENIPISKKQVGQLRKHKSMLRKYRYGRFTKDQRKQLLKQSGGFLNALLPIATSFLGSILGIK